MLSRAPDGPSIVFFMVDQLSGKWLEAASVSVCPTPNINRLRESGVTFTNAISSNPVCCPTRTTIATGLTTRGHGVLENGYQLDASIRVPLVIMGPGLQRGVTCDELVQLEDICPTVFEMAGLAHPVMPKMGPYLKAAAESIPTLPGRSLLSFCRGERPSGWRGEAYSESYNAIWSVTPGDWARTIRTKDFRYISGACR